MSRQRASSSDTRPGGRSAIMRAAERCVAERGLAGAPLSIIHRAAGQRNTSATQYHFGSREALISAILTERMEALDSERLRRLNDLEAADGKLPALRSIVAAWIYPLADQLRPRPDGNHYLRFLERLRNEEAPRFAEQIVRLQPGYRKVFSLLAEHLGHLPPVIVQSRIGLAAEQVIAGLGRLELELEALPEAQRRYPAFAVESLIDYISGGLIAAVSPATISQVGEANVVDFRLQFLDLNDGMAR